MKLWITTVEQYMPENDDPWTEIHRALVQSDVEPTLPDDMDHRSNYQMVSTEVERICSERDVWRRIGVTYNGKKFKSHHQNFELKHSRQISCAICDKGVLTPAITFDEKESTISVRAKIICPWCLHKMIVVIHKTLDRVDIEDTGTNTIDPVIFNQLKPSYGSPVGYNYTSGVAATTPLVLQKINENQYKARSGVAIMGTVNFPEMIGANPFDLNYHDNYVEGTGTTAEEAIDNLIIEHNKLSDTLFH